MKHKIVIVLVLLFCGVIIFGQSTSSDSLKKMRDSLKLEMERLRKLPPGCTEFEIHDLIYQRAHDEQMSRLDNHYGLKKK